METAVLEIRQGCACWKEDLYKQGIQETPTAIIPARTFHFEKVECETTPPIKKSDCHLFGQLFIAAKVRNTTLNYCCT